MSHRRIAAALTLAMAAGGCMLPVPRWPASGPLTSAFGLRFRGIRPEIHRGVDLGVPTGTEIHAMTSGRVRYAGSMRGYGKVVWLTHRGSVLTVYAHLSEIRVRTGAPVRAGAVIGLSGASGDATAPHLHFEIWRWGRQTDPVPLLGGPPPRRLSRSP